MPKKPIDPKEVLNRAITIAVMNGWNPGGKYYVQNISDIIVTTEGITISLCMEQLLYSHKFAQALFGKKLIQVKQTNEIVGITPPEVQALHAWQYHLQQMVIADHPLLYLSENLSA